MTDVQHILYNTIGNEFEKYLEPKELMTMSKVSKTTREGELNVKFRTLLEWTMKEYEIFRTNNTHDQEEMERDMFSPEIPTYNLFFQHIPLGVIYKNAQLDMGLDIYMVLDYLGCNKTTRLYVWIELCELEDFKKYMNSKMMDDYWELVEQASIRLRPDIAEFLFSIPIDEELAEEFDLYIYYLPTERLVKLFNDRLEDDEYLSSLLYYATSFQEQDTFREIYIKYKTKIPDYIESMLNNITLKYNINVYNEMLDPINNQ